MSENKFHHIERDPYQKENIDLALKIVIWIMSELWLDNTSYDPNKVFYVDSMGDFWGRNLNWGNRTEIDFRFSFNTKVHIHEILHAFSRDEKDLGNHEYLTRSGYHTCFR